jgi:hypothetical protein
MQTAAERAETKLQQSRLLTEERYLEEQQGYLKDVDRQHVLICFIGPENLPVAGSAKVQDVWVENLIAGVNYVVLWFLCIAGERAITSLSPELKKIGRRVAEVDAPHSGTIYHYGLQLLDSPNDRFEKNRKAFEHCMGKIEGNKFIKPLPSDSIKAELKREFLRYYNALGSMVVYYHNEPGVQALASSWLRRVRTAVNGETRSTYFFLDKDDCIPLAELLRDFFSAIPQDALPQSGRNLNGAVPNARTRGRKGK